MSNLLILGAGGRVQEVCARVASSFVDGRRKIVAFRLPPSSCPFSRFPATGWMLRLFALCMVAASANAQLGLLGSLPSPFGIFLARPDSTVYVFRGSDQAPGPFLVRYDPPLSLMRLADPPAQERSQYGVLLADGRILLCDLSCYVYSEATNRWVPAFGFLGGDTELVRLNDGRILRAGGFNSLSTHGYWSATYVLDPASGSSTKVGDLNVGRDAALFVRMADGRVLVVAGVTRSLNSAIPFGTSVAEVFDPATGNWARVADIPERFSDTGSSGTLAQDGRVFIASTSHLYAYDPQANSWGTFADAKLPYYTELTVLPNGLLFAAGGEDSIGAPVSQTVLFDALTSSIRPSAPLRLPRDGNHLITLANGRVLAAGGLTSGRIGAPTVEAFAWEPQTKITLDRGFYVATATQHPQGTDGLWGLEVQTSGEIVGGLNFGGLLAGGGQEVAWGAFYVGDAQTVSGTVDLEALPGTNGPLDVTATILDANKKPVATPFRGTGALTFSQTLQPGFYIVELRSGSQAPPAAFQATVLASRLLGGGSAGASSQQSAGVTGYVGFYLPTRQDVTVNLYNENTFGRPRGVGEAYLTLYDLAGNVLQRNGPGVMGSSQNGALPADPGFERIRQLFSIPSRGASPGNAGQPETAIFSEPAPDGQGKHDND